MDIKIKNTAKRCAYCKNFMPNRGNGGCCRIDGTVINKPRQSVCQEKKFEPLIK